MSFHISPNVTFDDISNFIPQLLGSLNGTSPLVNTLYPGNTTCAGQQAAVTRLINQQASDPCIKWIKVSDSEENGNILAMTQLCLLDCEAARREMIEEDIEIEAARGSWGNEEEEEYASEVYKAFMEPRRDLLREEAAPVLCE
jgi:hypothetical protein